VIGLIEQKPVVGYGFATAPVSFPRCPSPPRLRPCLDGPTTAIWRPGSNSDGWAQRGPLRLGSRRSPQSGGSRGRAARTRRSR
jgi:hypothetical protein